MNDVLDRLVRLVEAALIVFDDHDDVPRYRMLDTVRQYAAAQLDDAHTGESVECSLAHATHYSRVATDAHERETQDYEGFLHLCDQELGNLDAAISWAYGNGHPLVGLTITSKLWSHYVARRRYDAAMRNLRTGLELIEDVTPDVLRAAALALIAVNNSDDHDWDFNDRLTAMVEEHLDTVDDPALQSTLLRGLAACVGHVDPSRADSCLRAAAELPQAPALDRFLAIHNRVGSTWWSGRLDDPEATLTQIDDLLDAVPTMRPAAVHLRAAVGARTGNWDDVVRLSGSSVQMTEYGEARLQFSRIEALTALGRLDEALTVLRQVELVPSKDHGAYVPYLRSSRSQCRHEALATITAHEVTSDLSDCGVERPGRLAVLSVPCTWR